MALRTDEENRAESWRENQREIEADRQERLAAIAGDEAQRAANYERWKPVILAAAERSNE